MAHARIWPALLALAQLTAHLLAEHANARPPVSILVLPPYCDTPSQEALHWQYSLPFLLNEQLGQISAVRIPPDGALELGPDDSLQFALREIGAKGVGDLTNIVKLGKVLEARKVVWSAYGYSSNRWVWSTRLVDVASSTMSPWFSANSDTPWGLVCKMRNLILREARIKISQAEIMRLDDPITTSSKALELMSIALYARNIGKSLLEVENTLRAALALDPKFQLANETMAATLVTENRPDDAAELLGPIVSAEYASARAHYFYAAALRGQGLLTLAREQLSLAHDMAPHDPWPLIRLAEISGRNANDWKQAISLLKDAIQIEPYNAMAHEEFAFAEAHLGNIPLANSELRATERYDSGLDGLLAVRLADVYALIGNLARAIANYQRFVSGAASIGLDSPPVRDAAKMLSELKPRLQPSFVTASEPRTFTPGELAAILQNTLGVAAHNTCLTNPLQPDAHIQKWAKELTGTANTDLEKAQKLFAGISQRFEVASIENQRTALQTAVDWRSPTAHLSCEDYTFLYVALAREVGLHAFCVLVKRDYESNLVSHACAGVFVGDKALLSDPAYQWFGVPHVEYQFLNDIEALGLYFAQSTNLNDLTCAVKLLPNQALPRFSLAMNLASRGEIKQARDMLNAGIKIDSTSWWSFFGKGIVDLYSKEPDASVRNLEKCLSLGPIYPQAHFYLAHAYASAGRLTDARDEYRVFVEQPADPQLLEQARNEITRITTILEDQGEPAETIHSGLTY